MRTQDWDDAIGRLEYAFQPIVNARSGVCYGYEALLRGWDRAGFESIAGVFDRAFADEALHRVELALRQKAVERFVELPHYRNARLFYNLDNRVLDAPDYQPGRTRHILSMYGLDSDAMCLEVSERHQVTSSSAVLRTLERYRAQRFGMALDDYGSGFSGLQLLYHCQPDFIKIDRFFVDGISGDARKRLFVSNTITMAHLLGVRVVCEGIETVEELAVCQELGCDFVQGYFVQRPTTNTAELLSAYPIVCSSLPSELGDDGVAAELVSKSTCPVPVTLHTAMPEALARFHDDPKITFLVVLDDRGEPAGILREESIKSFIFSAYGWALLSGSSAPGIVEYVTRCPVAEVRTPLEQLRRLFAHGEQTDEGIILTDNGRYVGFVSSAQLLRAINQREVELAREQNPLTGLPGNNRIQTYLLEALGDWRQSYVFAYFDLDGLKTFNDAYGFRRGDLAIKLFADVILRSARESGWFVGHVGGGDFFIGMKTGIGGFDGAIGRVNDVIEEFGLAVRDLYAPEDLARGGLSGAQRETLSLPRRSLMGVSAGVVHAPRGRGPVSPDGFGSLIGALKSSAKLSAARIATIEYDEQTAIQVREPA